MSFHTRSVNLHDPALHPRLIFAKGFLADRFERIVAGWITKPTGIMSEWWRDADGFTKYEIDSRHDMIFVLIAETLHTLYDKVTPESHVKLDNKVRSLMQGKNLEQFKDTFAELQLADVLARKSSLIRFEPQPDQMAHKFSTSRTNDFGGLRRN